MPNKIKQITRKYKNHKKINNKNIKNNNLSRSKTTRKNVKTRRKWSKKYKKSINCNKPKGFSQKQYCKYGRK